MRFSIVIPVYKTPEKLFSRCLASILGQINDYGQKYLDYEIILVYDGCLKEHDTIHSYTDRKMKSIVNPTYKQAYIPKCTVSAARNKCLELAQGDWIIWVDSDDTLQSFALWELEKLISKEGSNYDCFIYKANIFGNGLSYAKQMVDNYTFQGEMKFKEDVDKYKKVPEVLWRKCIRRKFLIDNNIKFNNTIKLYDDWYFHMLLMTYNPNCYKLPKALYNYHIRKNSLSTTSEKQNKRNYVYEVQDSLLEELSNRYIITVSLQKYLEEYCKEFIKSTS